jgi:tetrahydromethanopterin S-methyltransferase subunit G
MVVLRIKIYFCLIILIIIQSHYVEKVLKRFNQFDCHLLTTSFDASMKFYLNIGRGVNQLEYAIVIGCLIYAMT